MSDETLAELKTQAAARGKSVAGVTLDSNVYVSALQFGGICARLLGMARMGIIRVDISDAILSETVGVLRDKFGWEGYRLHFLRIELMRMASFVTPTVTLGSR